jgi:hypothetical protein
MVGSTIISTMSRMCSGTPSIWQLPCDHERMLGRMHWLAMWRPGCLDACNSAGQISNVSRMCSGKDNSLLRTILAIF